jgi:non-heme chloroperoxidase
LVDAVTPGLLRTPKNPDGMPLQIFDEIRKGVLANLWQYWEELAVAFYGANRPDSKVPRGCSTVSGSSPCSAPLTA